MFRSKSLQGLHIGAMPQHVLMQISCEHEELQTLIGLAQRCAANASHQECAQLLQQALSFVERHRHHEETLLARNAIGNIHVVHRDHEQLAIAIEQVLVALEQDHPAEIANMLHCVAAFLARTIHRDFLSIQRALATHPASEAEHLIQ